MQYKTVAISYNLTNDLIFTLFLELLLESSIKQTKKKQ